jgi:DNA-binding Lrp family transcriptional regulator
MVTAIVLLVVERDKVNSVAEELASMENITEVYSIAGKYDIAAIIRIKDNEGMADLVTNKLLKIAGIIRTETLVAFRVFSRHDLDDLFAIGANE